MSVIGLRKNRKAIIMDRDTIGAISTGLTNSGIGIVRIVGSRSFEIADKIIRGSKSIADLPSHTINYGHVFDGENIVDEVLVSVMRAPRTYTGEDTVEINCHGGSFVVSKVLELVITNGARLAEPGEITKRAFLNGKMDLSQSEAVIDIINAKNDYALKNSIHQLKGSVKKRVGKWREKIVYETAVLEAMLDDPENYDEKGYDIRLKRTVEEIIQELEKLIRKSDEGRILTEGIQTVIVGKPNVGKSSLLNVLVGKERAIVTDIEGTTRDALEERVNLGGLSLNVVDTAGIRETDDIIEKIGVDKAREYVEKGDLVIYVIDASVPLDSNDEKIIPVISHKKCIVLLNKSDLESVVDKEEVQEKLQKAKKEMGEAGFSENNLAKKGEESHTMALTPIIEISAKEELGIENFEKVLKDMFEEGLIHFDDEVLISNMRQKEALVDALNSLQRVVESIGAGLSEDFYGIDLMDAYESLGKIIGETVGEDLIHEIFGKFCVGK